MAWLERSYTDLSRPIRTFSFAVEAPEVGQRLDALLRAHFPWKSRSHYQRLLERGDVDLDGKEAKASTRMRLGQTISVKIPVDPETP